MIEGSVPRTNGSGSGTLSVTTDIFYGMNLLFSLDDARVKILYFFNAAFWSVHI
jgi:hypothetical protein